MLVSSSFSVHLVKQRFGRSRATVVCSALTEALNVHLFSFRLIIVIKSFCYPLLPEQNKTDPSMPIMVIPIHRIPVGLRCLRWAQVGLIQLCKPQVITFYQQATESVLLDLRFSPPQVIVPAAPIRVH